MYFLDLLFVIYKYETYFLKQYELYPNDKKYKIDKTFKEIQEIIKETLNKNVCKLSKNVLNSHVYNYNFPENDEYIKHVIKETNLINKDIINGLMFDLIKNLGQIYTVNLNFDKEHFIDDFIIKLLPGLNEKKILYDSETEDDDDEFKVLNLEEFQKNIKELGLPFFEFL